VPVEVLAHEQAGQAGLGIEVAVLVRATASAAAGAPERPAAIDGPTTGWQVVENEAARALAAPMARSLEARPAGAGAGCALAQRALDAYGRAVAARSSGRPDRRDRAGTGVSIRI